MSIVRRLQHGARRLRSRVTAGRVPAASGATERAALRLTFPNPFGGEPWGRVEVALTRRGAGEGERLHLQGYIDGCLRLPAEPEAVPALASSAGGERSLARRSRAAASGLVRRGLAGLPRTPLAPLLNRRVRGWVDVRAAELPLAAGARDLMPAGLRELCGGDLPRAPAGQPRLGTWFTPLAGARRGTAQLTVLQLDSDDLPADYRGRPFALHASLATVLEEEPDGGRD